MSASVMSQVSAEVLDRLRALVVPDKHVMSTEVLEDVETKIFTLRVASFCTGHHVIPLTESAMFDEGCMSCHVLVGGRSLTHDSFPVIATAMSSDSVTVCMHTRTRLESDYAARAFELFCIVLIRPESWYLCCSPSVVSVNRHRLLILKLVLCSQLM